jgi:uncharacterized protein (UPF0332 family)
LKVNDLFEKAAVALKSSEALLALGDLDGSCNRAYYAMFDAARAALIATGSVVDLNKIKTHAGLISSFSLFLVKTGQVSVELGKSLNKVEDLRLMADYQGRAVTRDKVVWALSEARVFVAALQKFNKTP